MADIDTIARDLDEAVTTTLDEKPVRVLVMGPSLESSAPAAVLRRYIIDRAEQYADVFSAEHTALIEVAAEHMGEGYHLTAYEMYLVEISDLVVLIPASPGSYCELGLFSSYKDAGNKLLVLADKKFPLSGSYVADGPIASARINGARVVPIDYGDHDTASGLVKAQVDKIRVREQMARMLGSTG